MRTEKNNEPHIIADDGKVLKRKADGIIFGKEIYLGYTYFIGNEQLEEPKLETIDDFEEVEEDKSLIEEREAREARRKARAERKKNSEKNSSDIEDTSEEASE